MTSISCAGCCAALTAREMLNDNHVVAQIMESVPEVEIYEGLNPCVVEEKSSDVV
jgi:hypothetical protein